MMVEKEFYNGADGMNDTSITFKLQGDEIVAADKVTLANGSPIFSSTFCGKTTAPSVIELPNVKKSAFVSFLKFFEQKKNTGAPEAADVLTLIMLGQMYEMPEFVSAVLQDTCYTGYSLNHVLKGDNLQAITSENFVKLHRVLSRQNNIDCFQTSQKLIEWAKDRTSAETSIDEVCAPVFEKLNILGLESRKWRAQEDNWRLAVEMDSKQRFLIGFGFKPPPIGFFNEE